MLNLPVPVFLLLVKSQGSILWIMGTVVSCSFHQKGSKNNEDIQRNKRRWIQDGPGRNQLFFLNVEGWDHEMNSITMFDLTSWNWKEILVIHDPMILLLDKRENLDKMLTTRPDFPWTSQETRFVSPFFLNIFLTGPSFFRGTGVESNKHPIHKYSNVRIYRIPKSYWQCRSQIN